MRRFEEVQFEIWWDRPIQTTVKLDHNRSNVILINWQDNEWTIAEFSVTWDRNMLLKEEEKVTRYNPLTKEIHKVQGVSIKIIPIIMGSLGKVTNQLRADFTVLGMERTLGGIHQS